MRHKSKQPPAHWYRIEHQDFRRDSYTLERTGLAHYWTPFLAMSGVEFCARMVQYRVTDPDPRVLLLDQVIPTRDTGGTDGI